MLNGVLLIAAEFYGKVKADIISTRTRGGPRNTTAFAPRVVLPLQLQQTERMEGYKCIGNAHH